MNIEGLKPIENEFANFGGEVLEYSDDGNPTRWICGVTNKGKFIHPPEIDIDSKDLYTGIEPHPVTGENCWVASLDEPSDLKDWAYN